MPTDRERTDAPSGRRTIRVVIGEENLIAREGIVPILRAIDGVEVLAACADLPGLREAIARLQPDVVVTDVRLSPGESDDGIQLARELRATHPQTAVVVLSPSVDPHHAASLLDEGAAGRGYLVTDRVRDVAEVGRALHEVAGGGSVVDPRVVDHMLSRRASRRDSPLSALTPREREVLKLVASGCSNAAIADSLGITRRAVERHINAIFSKLGLVDRQRISPRVTAALLFLAEQ